ncbi:DUF4255 domain-containing protein [Geodermatophilus poikilotrophus]|uniref:Pvc16 N-terminal domain-containing protein n=1 Tax=Geodermatophilus poikilotrophus TaxID=1333667 RepID=A0A1H9Z0T1_9ACTN|nr:DUF4255 domain-containing protein [Geodermatophilus poikilotrophus]SES75074.1 Protein of unknown function [Geodermatophilus poikilotrophus]
MANHLAIATVTEALRLRLAGAIGAEVAGADVAARRPQATDGDARSQVTIFLYRITPNAALRNEDLPTRGSDPTEVRRRPRAAVDLHYLLSFSGDEEQLVPQRMLGTSLAALHSAPGLSRAELAAASQGEPWLTESDLAEELESVHFSPGDLSLDDMSKVWSTFLQVPYRLSVAYGASVVLIEAPVATREPLPVQQGGVDAVAARQPVVDRVRPGGGDAAAGAPSELEVLGRNLRGPSTAVRFDGGDPRPVTTVTDTRIVVPAAGLPAGVHVVQVVHRVAIGVPPLPHDAVESAGVSFVLRPAVTATFEPAAGPSPDPAAGAVVVEFAPSLAAGQRVVLMLNEHLDPLPSGRTLGFHRLEPEAVPSAGATTLRFRRGTVPAGTYLVRVQVDGAESTLDLRRGGTPPSAPTPQVTLP